MNTNLLELVDPEDAPDGALTGRQLVELKEGVRAAIEDADHAIGSPGDLHGEHWNHAGVGVSLFMHRSGVVVMSSRGDMLVTDAATLDHFDTAAAIFHVDPGPAVVANDNPDEQTAD